MTDILGYAASRAVLATFLTRTMVPLRLIAILSNVLFVAFGYAQHIYPVLFLHVALLPINIWRLVTARIRAGVESATARQLPVPSDAPQPYALWFVVGLLAGLVGSFAVLAMTVMEPI
jgi:hypothetical protein